MNLGDLLLGAAPASSGSDVGPWLAAAAAVVGTTATALVSIFTGRTQANLTRDERQTNNEREDKRSAAEAVQKRSSARATAVRALIHQERAKAARFGTDLRWVYDEQGELERLANEVMLLAHRDEKALRTALTSRLSTPNPDPSWWYPWVIGWINSPDAPVFDGASDSGKMSFSDPHPPAQF